MRVVRGGASQGGAVPLYPLRPMPFEQATAWGPALTGDARPSRPQAPGQVFITPDVLRAVAWHTASRSDGGSVGFFAGRRHIDPDTKEPWVLVDAVIPVDRPDAPEQPGTLIDQTIDQAGDVARTALRYLVGWYLSHHARQPVLTAAAIETHERYFADELHALVMVVTVGHEEARGAVFRPGIERGPVPFYEVFEDAVELAQHPRPTALQWRNYFTVESVKREVTGRRAQSLWDPLTPPGAGTEPQSAQGTTPAPSDASSNAEGPRPAPSLPRGPERRSGKRVPRSNRGAQEGMESESLQARWAQRWLVLLGSVAIAAVAMIAIFALFGMRQTVVPPPAPAHDPPPPAVTALDSVARSMTAAVRAYGDVALLFDRRQVGCEQLAPALVTLEEHWMGYAVAKSGLGRPLDAAAVDRERDLDVGVRRAEEHFLTSACPRP